MANVPPNWDPPGPPMVAGEAISFVALLDGVFISSFEALDPSLTCSPDSKSDAFSVEVFPKDGSLSPNDVSPAI